MTNRKFYKTIIRVEILSEEPFEHADLGDIYWQITEGDCSGQHEVLETQTLDGKQAARELEAQGSDPSFFGLNEDGEDDEYFYEKMSE